MRGKTEIIKSKNIINPNKSDQLNFHGLMNNSNIVAMNNAKTQLDKVKSKGHNSMDKILKQL